MRVLTPLARPGLRLAKPIIVDGRPLLGKGTALTRRYLRSLYSEGVHLLEVEPDARVQTWEQVPDVNEFVTELERRFSQVQSDPRMMMVKQAVADVYLDFLFELES
jgi:hypothetical protein